MSLSNDSPLIPSNVTWKDAVTINNNKETTENHQFSTVSLASAWCFARFYILFYNSFKIFPQFWLAKSTRIIHHKQLLMTKLGRILCLKRKWRQKCSLLQVNAPLTVKTWGRGWVVFVVKTKMADWLSTVWFIHESHYFVLLHVTSVLNRFIHVLNRDISILYRTIFGLHRIVSLSNTKWDVRALLLLNKLATKTIE